MYVKCGNLDEACKLFIKVPEHDIVTWDTMIAAYVKHGNCYLGLECFENMQETGIIPDCVTFLSVLKACGSIGAIEQGRKIHQKIIESGLQSGIVIGGMIVDMYAKCGNLEEARQVFNALKDRDLVVWNAMIDGYAQNEKELLALECFDNMHQEGIAPSVVTFLSMLKACSRIGAIDLGRNIHKQIREGGFEPDINVLSTLVDMYAKCGNLKEAYVVFNKLLDPDIVAWNAMIAGYVQIGDVESAFVCFEDMRYRGPKPDAIAFTSILTACGRAGLVEEGYWYCGAMKYYHRIRPDIFQVTCMVDLLGRAGCFKDVEYFIQHVEELNIHVWLSLLGTCRMYMNAELGRRCFNKIVVLDSSCEAAYVMLSNIYGSA